jgi:hypothetical protein
MEASIVTDKTESITESASRECADEIHAVVAEPSLVVSQRSLSYGMEIDPEPRGTEKRLTKPSGKTAVSSFATRAGEEGTLSRALGPSQKKMSPELRKELKV